MGREPCVYRIRCYIFGKKRMECNHSQAALPEDSLYCCRCGNAVNATANESVPDLRRSLNALAIVTFFHSFLLLFWIWVNEVITPLLMRDDLVNNTETLRMIYKSAGWIFALISVALGVVFTVLCKVRMARVAMIVYLVFQTLGLIFYQIIPLFTWATEIGSPY